MKVVYLLVLISLVTSLTTIEKIKCFTGNENLLDHIVKVIDAIKAKDFHKVLSTILSGYFSVKNEIEDCLNDEPNLGMTYCAWKCRNDSDKRECIKRCENGGDLVVEEVKENVTLTKN